MRLHPSASRLGAGVVFATAFVLISCSSSSNPANDSDAGDASGGGDAAPGGDSTISVGDDASDEGIVIEDSSLTGNCAVPNGTYTLTMTPVGDGGGWDDDAAEGDAATPCVPMTSTVVFPWKMGGSTGLECTLAPDGDLPACTIDFNCTLRGATTTTNSTGYIQIYDTSIGGYEGVDINENGPGMQAISTCHYNLSYVKK